MKIVVELKDDYLKESIAEQISATVARELDTAMRERIETILATKFSRVDEKGVAGALKQAANDVVTKMLGGDTYRVKQQIDALVKDVVTKLVTERLKDGLR
jgi:uncharacterized protein (UPF0297 family)